MPLHAVPWWLAIPIAALLLISAICALTAAWGLERLPGFFLRMHPPALVYTGGSWSACLACLLYFSAAAHEVQLRAWIIVILLAVTAPITTVLISRAALFRARVQGGQGAVPTALQPMRQRDGEAEPE